MPIPCLGFHEASYDDRRPRPMEDRQRCAASHKETNVAKSRGGVAPPPRVAASSSSLEAAGISVTSSSEALGRSGHATSPFLSESDLKTAEKLVKAAAKEVGATRVSSAGGIAKLSSSARVLGTPSIAARMFRALADSRHQHRDDQRRVGCVLVATR
jgi:aspartokinase